jgi:hypothetical protein
MSATTCLINKLGSYNMKINYVVDALISHYFDIVTSCLKFLITDEDCKNLGRYR